MIVYIQISYLSFKVFGNENLYCKQSRFYITGELYTFPTTSLLHPVENLFYSFK